MKNKFLKTYPQLWEPKIGDKVRVIQVLTGHRTVCKDGEWAYNRNDTGVITDCDSSYNGYKTYGILFDETLKKGQREIYVFQDEIELDI